jgi:hypothetical protein
VIGSTKDRFIKNRAHDRGAEKTFNRKGRKGNRAKSAKGKPVG